jgi:hypothetical protein
MTAAKRVIITGTSIILLGVMTWAVVLAYRLSTADGGPEVRLPLFAILGVIALLSALALIAVAFAGLGLTDKTQALALPEGSVRAVIALSLIVLFAIVSVSLYSSLADGPVKTVPGLTSAKRTLVVNDPRIRVIAVDSVARVSTSTPPETTYVFSVDYWAGPNQASQDFAKQLLVMIGTLVTSIASFYFGAKAASANVVPDEPAPSLEASSTMTIARGTKTDLVLKGTGLQGVKAASLTRGSEKVDVADVSSNATEVKGNVTIPSTSQPGTWDLTVTDSRGRTARLGVGVTVT